MSEVRLDDGMDATYGASEPRRTEAFTVKALTERGASVTVETRDSTGFALPTAKLTRPLAVGGTYTLECVRYSQVVGVSDAHGWLYRLSDQDVAERGRSIRDAFEQRKQAELAEHRQEWEARSAALPGWLQDRLRRFHNAGGEKFALEGWGYELVVCELAWAYFDGDQARVDSIDAAQGCSGNQHECARFLARVQREGGDLTPTQVPAAMAPLTGSADYRGI